MTAQEAFKALHDYLQEEGIEHYPIIDPDFNAQILYMAFNSQHSPPVPLEGEVFFFEDGAEVRCYYGEQISACIRESKYRAEVLDLINHINARVYSSEPNCLFTPRMYITADSGCDLTITTVVDYRIWDYLDCEGSEELYHYITRYCPRLLDLLAVPIIGLLSEQIDITGAISYIERTITEG